MEGRPLEAGSWRAGSWQVGSWRAAELLLLVHTVVAAARTFGTAVKVKISEIGNNNNGI